MTAPDHTIIAVTVVVTTPAGSAGIQAGLASAAPGFFTADTTGCGQAAALNVRPDGAVSVNSPSNSAAPGDYVALFGTGFGVSSQPLDDGAASTGPSSLNIPPALTVDATSLPFPAYAGLAPGLAGVDQINFQVPATMRNGCAVPVVVSQALPSQEVTISVQNGRGQCTDPPIQSYGLIGLNSAGSQYGDSFYASFPAGPNLTPVAPETVVYAPNFAANANGISWVRSEFPIHEVRSCAVPGYTNLSAGTIRITPPSGSPVTFEPSGNGNLGAFYGGSLPSGFIGPGVYTISGPTAASVNLSTKITVGSPIQIQTPFPPGTVISSREPLTIRWTGGDPDSVVRFALTSSTEQESASSYTYAHVADGSLTINPICTRGNPLNPNVCTFGIPPSSNASIIVQVMPDPASKPTIAVPGITGPVSLSWSYAYQFPFLVLTQ